MDEIYNELIETVKCLNAVAVTGEYWLIMQACVNSILKVCETIKNGVMQNDTVNNNT